MKWLALSFLFSGVAFADSRLINSVVVCNGAQPVTVDYFNALLPTEEKGVPTLIELGATPDDTIAILDQRLDKMGFSTFRLYFKGALKNISTPNKWIETDLSSAPSEAYPLPAGCVLRAVTLRDASSATYFDRAVFDSLTPAQQGLVISRMAFQTIHDNNPDNVRFMLRSLLNSGSDYKDVQDGILRLNSNFASWLEIQQFDGVFIGPANVDINDPYEKGRVAKYKARLSINADDKQVQLTMYNGNIPINSSKDWKWAPKTLKNCGWGDIVQFTCEIEASVPYPFEKDCGKPYIQFQWGSSNAEFHLDLYAQGSEDHPKCLHTDAFRALVGGRDFWESYGVKK